MRTKESAARHQRRNRNKSHIVVEDAIEFIKRDASAEELLQMYSQIAEQLEDDAKMFNWKDICGKICGISNSDVIYTVPLRELAAASDGRRKRAKHS